LKITFVIAISILILVGYQSKSKKEIIIENKPIFNENRIESKNYGDSLRIEYEYRGDTIIQSRIDLKVTSDDNFDSSFTVVSVWSTRETSELNCLDKLKLTRNSIDFIYCYDEILEKIDRDISKAEKEGESWKVQRINELKTKLSKYKNGAKIDLKWIKEYYIFDLLREIDFDIYDNQKKTEVKIVRVEEYETDFSGGRNYYLLTKTNDTIAKFDALDWIR
jgi:hypothetical protein